ncbi:MAG TPA: DUF2062 domain-containing protein [Methylomirabilota bacterium]|jgi:uncharacterized protein (DUF2062 family)|nr:DUF2062 domain-containing protein [Methylomirabilota bacterium]
MKAAVRRLRERFLALLHLDDPPWRVALALAVGVFISFTPFLGFQTLLALLVGTVFRLNAAVVVTGTWLNLPWFMPFVYAGSLKVGALLLPDLKDVGDWSLALLIGTTLLGSAAAVVTYVVALGVMRRRGKHRSREPRSKREAA